MLSFSSYSDPFEIPTFYLPFIFHHMILFFFCRALIFLKFSPSPPIIYKQFLSSFAFFFLLDSLMGNFDFGVEVADFFFLQHFDASPLKPLFFRFRCFSLPSPP